MTIIPQGTVVWKKQDQVSTAAHGTGKVPQIPVKARYCGVCYCAMCLVNAVTALKVTAHQ